MRRLAIVAVAACALAAGVRAEAQAAAPDPACRRLDYFVGTWKGDGEQKASSLDAAPAKFAGTMSCAGFAGGFNVVCTLDGTMGAHPFREMATFGYDPEEKAYTWYDIDNFGMNGLARGLLVKGTWTYLFEMKAGGKPVTMKVTLVEQSPDAFLNTAEVSVDGKPPEVTVQATFRRTR